MSLSKFCAPSGTFLSTSPTPDYQLGWPSRELWVSEADVYQDVICWHSVLTEPSTVFFTLLTKFNVTLNLAHCVNTTCNATYPGVTVAYGNTGWPSYTTDNRKTVMTVPGTFSRDHEGRLTCSVSYNNSVTADTAKVLFLS